MPRILGVDIPNDKPTHISLRYIYGIGPTLALRICAQAKIDPQKQAKELTDDEISRLASILDRDYTVEGPLRRQVQQNMVTSAHNSGVWATSKNACFSRIARYSGSDRPAWRMNHTGVRSTSSRRAARTRSGSITRSSLLPPGNVPPAGVGEAKAGSRLAL
jgi:ribosomal protein S13